MMGTDIHVIAQARDDKDSPWRKVDIPTDPKWEYWNVLNGRNYDVFAILANVRNGRGFAGVKTSDGFPFISDCRGIPEDAGFEMDDETGDILCAVHRFAGRDEDDECDDCVWLGDHSHTWVTLREIFDYEWDGQVAHSGVVDEKEYLDWKATDAGVGLPHSYSADVGGQTVQMITEEEYLAGTRARPGKHLYIRFTRSTPRRLTTLHFLEYGVEWLKTLGDPENVRLVMGFDS